MKGSVQTTSMGLAAILIVVGNALMAYFDDDPLTTVDMGVLVPALIAGIGLIMARDNNKSSEEVGVK